MTRLTDVNICIEKIKQLPITYDAETVQRCIEVVSNAPTIEAVPVKRGKWEMKPDLFGFFHDIPVCSECGCTTKMREKTKYCPHCGARMDEDERDC